MSPYSLRKRTNIKAPRRFDDDNHGSSPRSPRENSPEAVKSRESPQLEELRWPSPPRKRSTKKDAYRGPVIEFNPNLPPAPFPTLDKPRPITKTSSQDQDNSQDDMHPELPILDLSDKDSLVSGNEFHQRVNSRTMSSTPTRSSSSSTRPRFGPSITVESPMGVASTNGLGQFDNGPQNAIWARNVKMIGELARRTSFDWIMTEMDTSDEEEQPAKAVKKEVSAWDDLTITHKLDLADSIYELYPEARPERIMEYLLLDREQAGVLTNLLLKRQKRIREEETSAKLLRDHTHEQLLSGRRISETGYCDILEQTIYRHVGEEDHLQTTPSELAKAKAYLKHCGFDPSLLDDTWVRPVSGNATPKDQSSDSSQKAHATRDVPHSSDDSASDSSSQPPSKSTPVHQPANPVLPKHGQAQRTSNGAPPRRRPTAAEMIAAHSSPVPAHVVPSRGFPVVPTCGAPQLRPPRAAEMIAGHSSPVASHLVPSRQFPVASGQPRREDTRAGTGQPRASISHPPRSSLPSQPQIVTAEYTQATNSVLLKAPNLSAKLTPPGEPTLVGSPKGPSAANQVLPEPTSRKRTASQAIPPPTAATQDMSLTENSDGAAPKKKRTYNKKSTAGASTATTITAAKTSTKQSRTPKTTPTPAAPTTSAPPAPYPWASDLGSTAANDGKVRGWIDGK